jgi:uncharacterized membrane protein
MERPPRPEPPSPQKGSAISIILAAILALVVGAVLIVLTIGVFANVMAAIAILFGVAALHYVVWGRWLMNSVRDEVEAEEAIGSTNTEKRDRLNDRGQLR